MEEFLHNLSAHEIENLDSYPRISYSEASSWVRCQRQWHYQYGKGYTYPTTPSYFSRGHYLHGLMANLLAKEDIQQAHTNTLEKLREEDGGFDETSIQEDVERLQQQALEVAQTILVGNTVLGVEKEFFYRPEGGKVLIHGFIDAVLRNSNGELWIVDFKTAARRWSESQFLLSTQDILYAAAVSECMNELVAGTTYAIFAPAGIDYKTRRVTLEGMDNVLNDVLHVATQRGQARLNVAPPLSPLWGCGGCPFQQTCRTYVAGGDTEYVLESNFVVDEERVERTRINLGLS